MAIEDNDNTVVPDTTSMEGITTMKEARFDVFKFGVKGFDKEGQLSAREALAIRLGAKPAKQKGTLFFISRTVDVHYWVQLFLLNRRNTFFILRSSLAQKFIPN